MRVCEHAEGQQAIQVAIVALWAKQGAQSGVLSECLVAT